MVCFVIGYPHFPTNICVFNVKRFILEMLPFLAVFIVSLNLLRKPVWWHYYHTLYIIKLRFINLVPSQAHTESLGQYPSVSNWQGPALSTLVVCTTIEITSSVFPNSPCVKSLLPRVELLGSSSIFKR